MRCLPFFLIAIISSVSVDHVVDLGDSDFDSKLADMETAMVLFYHPECDCNLTYLEQTARDLLLEWPPVFVARVNCAGAGATCRRFEVGGHPTIKLFKNGVFTTDLFPTEASWWGWGISIFLGIIGVSVSVILILVRLCGSHHAMVMF